MTPQHVCDDSVYVVMMAVGQTTSWLSSVPGSTDDRAASSCHRGQNPCHGDDVFSSLSRCRSLMTTTMNDSRLVVAAGRSAAVGRSSLGHHDPRSPTATTATAAAMQHPHPFIACYNSNVTFRLKIKEVKRQRDVWKVKKNLVEVYPQTKQTSFKVQLGVICLHKSQSIIRGDSRGSILREMWRK